MELTEIYLQILFLKIGLVRCFHAAFFWETVTNPPSARYHAWFSVTLCGSVSLQAPGSRLPASPLPCSGIEFLWGMPLPLYSCFDHVIKKHFPKPFLTIQLTNVYVWEQFYLVLSFAGGEMVIRDLRPHFHWSHDLYSCILVLLYCSFITLPILTQREPLGLHFSLFLSRVPYVCADNSEVGYSAWPDLAWLDLIERDRC